MLYRIYHAATYLSGPALRLMTQMRLGKGKEDGKRVSERYGVATIDRPPGQVMWFHGASVGESLSALPLLKTLQARLPGWTFLITTNTVTSAAMMAQRLPPGMIHQFIPWDHPIWVRRFLTHWQPNAIVWLESELWPNLLHEIKQRNIPTALLNARMRPRTFVRWQKLQTLAAQMLSTFRFILVGARDYRRYFETLGGQNVRYIGSLKFTAHALPVNEGELQRLQQNIGARRVIAFISTHATEETMAGHIFKKLQAQYPDLLMVIAPRKPSRGNEIIQELNLLGLNCAIRSQNQEINSQTNIYVADTMGELGLWYSLAPIAVIGGSFIPHGGQNPIEGTHFGCAMLYGPHMFNFPELCLALEEAGAALPVADQTQLVGTLETLLRNPTQLAQMRAASSELAEQNVSVIDSFADEITIQLVDGA